MPDLRDGEERSVPGSSGRSYTIKNVGGVYSCSCPAWRNQHAHPHYRTCKHLSRFRGSDVEARRIAGGSGVSASPIPSRPAGPSYATTRIPARPAPPPPRPAPPPPAPQPTAWNRLMDWDPVLDGPEPPPPPAPEVSPSEPDEAEGTFAMLLAETWDGVQDPTGWSMSEKLDGVRAYWDGEKFISRQGNVFQAPDWYKAEMPKTPLDGEFWMGRGRFQETSGYVRRQDKGEYWRDIGYMIFDAPEAIGGFEKRLTFLKSLRLPAHAQVLTQRTCLGLDDLRAYLLNIERLDGEGVMLRKPGSLYVRTRSNTLLKVKSFYDAEAKVTGYTAGKGKHKGRVGALECIVDKPTSFVTPRGRIEIPVGTTFKVGTGLSDAQRLNPPQVGADITFRFKGLTNKRVPREPSFVGERNYE